jgi:hypothetical protein
LRDIAYLARWLWRGEVSTSPFLFVRPLLDVFLKGHFERRLRRLKTEVLLSNDLSDGAREALTRRLDGALERWRSPRLTAIFFSVIVPGVISLPGWHQQVTEFLAWIGLSGASTGGVLPAGLDPAPVIAFVPAVMTYFVAIPVTAFLVKRGLFLGREPSRAYFPGGQPGAGFYAREREILAGVDIRMREVPIDVWILGILTASMVGFQAVFWREFGAAYPDEPLEYRTFMAGLLVALAMSISLLVLARIRRGRTGRQ